MANGTTILETEGLSKNYGGLTAVDDVNFRLPKGELRCLIGPNGAGKSTFFKMLAGRISPDSGRIKYQGKDITDLHPHERVRLGLSIKFQTVSVYSDLTLQENLRIPLQRTVPMDQRQERIDDLLELMNLQEAKSTTASDLSHGQRQWLEIAMTLAIDPELLLLDEPTAGMSVDKTEQTGELIKTLVENRGMSVIVTEHDINFVRQIAERITVLHNGAIFAEGTVDEIEADEDVKRIYLGTEENSEESS